MQNCQNSGSAELKKKQTEKAPPTAAEGVTDSINASVINACYSQHNGVTKSTEDSAGIVEETQSLRRKTETMFSQTSQPTLKAPGNSL